MIIRFPKNVNCYTYKTFLNHQFMSQFESSKSYQIVCLFLKQIIQMICLCLINIILFLSLYDVILVVRPQLIGLTNSFISYNITCLRRNITHVQNILIFLTLQLNVAHINISVLNTVPYFLILGVKKKK